MLENDVLIIEGYKSHYPTKIKQNKSIQKSKSSINEIISKSENESNKCNRYTKYYCNNKNLICPNVNKKEMNKINPLYNLNTNNYSNFINYSQNSLFNAIHYINFLKMQINNVQKNLSDILYKREKGLQAISNPSNINHYLIKYINNNNRAYNNFFPSYDISQMNPNTNSNNYNFQTSMKNNPIEKESKLQSKNAKDKFNNANENKKITKNESNVINIMDIRLGKEKRTVVRLSPIPPNYSSFDVSKLLDKYLNIDRGQNQRIYKALFVPLCKVIGKNLGYCFIMLVKPKYVIKFFNTFNGTIFNKKKCKKPCKVVWANLQGDDFLNMSDNPLRSPIIFKDTIID